MKFQHTSLMLLLIAAGITSGIGYWFGSHSSVTEPVTATTEQSRVTTEKGVTTITLDEDSQRMGGIQTAALSVTLSPTGRTVYGSVLNLAPLIDLRASYLSAVAGVDAARAAVDASTQEARRSQALFHDDNNISLKALQSAQAALTADRTRFQVAELNRQSLYDKASAQFSRPLVDLITSPGNNLLSRLLNAQEMLLSIVFPGNGNSLPSQIAIDNGANAPVVASLIAPAMQSDATMEGQVGFYRAAAAFSSGSRVTARVPAVHQTVSKTVTIPSSAVVWFGGQPWVYLQQDKQRFVRRSIANDVSTDDGVFIDKTLVAGERIVTRGAQLLLSEEQRPPVSAVAACKDPECDD